TGTPTLSLHDALPISATAEDAFKSLVTDTSETTHHLNKILARMDAGQGTIGKALRDEELYNRMTDVAERLQGVMSKLESPRGPRSEEHTSELQSQSNL